jgi:hypothetical protein
VILPIALRPPEATDVSLILDSWLESYREEGANRHMSNDVYFAIYRPHVVALLQSAQVVVASNPADAWQIFGWACYAPGALHYVNVKRPFRRARVATRLVEAAGSPRVATHTGVLWGPISRAWGLAYDPR